MKKVMLTLLFAFLSVSLFAQVPVTFQVNMGYQIRHNLWAAGDTLVIRGDFEKAVDTSASDWAGYQFMMAPRATNDSVYVLVVNFPVKDTGTTFNYKFVETIKGADSWESTASGGNRSFKLVSPTVTLPVVNFSDQVDLQVATVKNIVVFTADLSAILGSGIGHFDPSADSIQVLGLSNWGGYNVDQTTFSGNRTLQPVFGQPGMYSTTLTFYGPVGDSTGWKFTAFPGTSFGNGGYETGGNRFYTFVADTVNANQLPVIVPVINPLFPALTKPLSVTLHVDMNHAVDFHNKLAIDPTKINFVGVSGGLSHALGPWTLNWTVSDTSDGPTYVDTISTIKVLHDDGKNGDQVAGDHIWSIQVTVPIGTPGGVYEYKFGCDYPGVDTVNNGSSYLDNEMGFGVNHSFLVIDGPAVVINNVFGVKDSVATGIKQVGNNIPSQFTLSQNYPNPFNPSTIIKYSVPKAQLVTLKVYNLLGQEVATLVNNQQNAGNYEVTFSADKLASGIYFYTLNAGNFVSTKKMILLK
jgi:hypothetical protein